MPCCRGNVQTERDALKKRTAELEEENAQLTVRLKQTELGGVADSDKLRSTLGKLGFSQILRSRDRTRFRGHPEVSS